ncbi:hypothetical protein ACX0GZ_02230 [Sphingomonas aestuarii]
MKKIVFAAAAAGLMSLAACNNAAVEENAVVQNLEDTADNYDAMADMTSNEVASDMYENMADNAEAMAENDEDAIVANQM